MVERDAFDVREPAPCGTKVAAWRHRRKGEPVDRACLDAAAEYARDRRVRKRQERPAREEALEALAWRHPEEFADLLRKAMAERG